MSLLFSAFSALPAPTPHDGAESFSAAPVVNAAHRVAKDVHGWPALLIVSSTPPEGAPRIRLEHLDIQHGVRCRITNDQGRTEEDVFTVVRCTQPDEELTRYFLHAFDPILRSLGPAPAASAVSRAVNSLAEIFRALTQPSTKSVSGLWAELAVIRQARNPAETLAAWHVTPEDVLDFNSGTQRVEVKSASGRQRSHHFSLEQLTPPSGCRMVVVSVFVEKSGGGKSLGELIGEIRELVDARPDLQERLDRVVATTLGVALPQALEERFDFELVSESMQYFEGGEIPRVPSPLPMGISDVHFKADLAHCHAQSVQELISLGGLFAAVAKR